MKTVLLAKWDFEDRFVGKVGFRDKHDVGIGVVEKMDKFRFVVQKSICVPRSDLKGINGQNGMGYLWQCEHVED